MLVPPHRAKTSDHLSTQITPSNQKPFYWRWFIPEDSLDLQHSVEFSIDLFLDPILTFSIILRFSGLILNLVKSLHGGETKENH